MNLIFYIVLISWFFDDPVINLIFFVLSPPPAPFNISTRQRSHTKNIVIKTVFLEEQAPVLFVVPVQPALCVSQPQSRRSGFPLLTLNLQWRRRDRRPSHAISLPKLNPAAMGQSRVPTTPSPPSHYLRAWLLCEEGFTSLLINLSYVWAALSGRGWRKPIGQHACYVTSYVERGSRSISTIYSKLEKHFKFCE